MEKKYFAESELIINEDGSIFHLHVKPEQLADKVILVGDPGRVDLVASHFETKECAVESREFRTVTGTYKGKRITVISTGIGCDNIDIVMNEVDALANIDFETRHEKERDGLPAFLVSNPGLNSGFMIPQYTAAGLMNEIKHLAVPATIDSIPTCAGQEDPVSMGYYASKKALMGVKKLQYVTAIEIYVALQAMDFLKPLEPSPVLGKLRDFIRKEVPFVDNDRYLYPDIAYITDRVRDCSLVDLVENEIGALQF